MPPPDAVDLWGCRIDRGAVQVLIERFLAGALVDIPNKTRLGSDGFRAAIASRQAQLTAAGFTAGRPVLIAHGGSADFFRDLFAVWGLGGIAACVSAELTASQRETLVRFLKPCALLATAEMALGESVSGVPVLAAHGGDGGVLRDIAVPSDGPCLILFTSGTTGDPKGVVHSWASLAARIDLNLAQIPAADLQRTLCALPTHFGHGLIGNSLTALAAGAELHLLGPRLARAGMEIGGLIDAHGITFLSSVPTLWKMALKLSTPPTRASLRRIHVGSAPLSAELWRAIQRWAGIEAVLNMYGITETANWVAGADPRRVPIEDGMVGEPWGGAFAVLDGQGRRQSQGDGEIVVSTPSLMHGYWARPDLTEAALCEGWYRTGDTGWIDAAGIVRLHGRIKDEINRAGMKVQPAEIDLLLERHSAVAEACCFGMPDDILGEKIAVAIVPAGAAAPDLAALKAWCRERLHAASVPERWFIVGEIPRTDRGKIRREAVMQYCLAREKL